MRASRLLEQMFLREDDGGTDPAAVERELNVSQSVATTKAAGSGLRISGSPDDLGMLQDVFDAAQEHLGQFKVSPTFSDWVAGSLKALQNASGGSVTLPPFGGKQPPRSEAKDASGRYAGQSVSPEFNDETDPLVDRGLGMLAGGSRN